MKKMMLISMMVFSVAVFSQNTPQTISTNDDVTATYYYKNGNVKQVGDYVEGKIDGNWISYSEEGTIQSIARYRDGKKHGKWEYYESPTVTKIVDYKNNNIVKIAILDKNQISTKN